MRIIVAGSRNFNDYEFIKNKLDIILNNFIKQNIYLTIVSGTCEGVDKLGERYSKENKLSLIQCPANWSKYNKSAGQIRNREMAEISDCLVAFWDGKSKGTKGMINYAKILGLKVRIILINQ